MGWDRIAVPSQWEDAGFDGMDGVAWYRTSFELTADDAKEGVRLGLGMIDDSDIAWVNGREVGRMTLAWNRVRLYDVPPALLRPGRNVVAVRVEDTGGGGGIWGQPDLLYVEVAGRRRPLAGEWRFRPALVTVNLDFHKNQVPTVLYNKMVHPLLSSPIRGVLWYQGESNAGPEDAFAYRRLFRTLIEDWRAGWGLGDLPFLWVQLANYLPAGAEPSESSWALLRESQSAVLALPVTAQAVTIDIGEARDIHPRNKQEVGRRLALAARRVAYGEDLIFSGPVYRRHKNREGQIVIEFAHVGRGLVAKGGKAPRHEGFTIAGPDRRFVRAIASVQGNRVVVWSDAVPNPVAVRYAWADNPEGANLFNLEGLPASPFRTDSW
jgi:sialate O-acetylesterase